VHGLPLWVSEFGTGRGAATLAEHIVRDLATLLPCAWVYWQAVEDEGSGWGLVEAPIAAVAQAVQQRSDDQAAQQRSDDHAAQQPAAQPTTVCGPHAVNLMPAFFVLKFLRQLLPPGAVLFRVAALRSRGFGIARSPRHAVVVVLNVAPDALMHLELDVSAWTAAAARSGGARLALRLSVLRLGRLSTVPAPPPGASLAELAAACTCVSGYHEEDLQGVSDAAVSGLLRLEVPAASLAGIHVQLLLEEEEEEE
jgi:hypothetical protein